MTKCARLQLSSIYTAFFMLALSVIGADVYAEQQSGNGLYFTGGASGGALIGLQARPMAGVFLGGGWSGEHWAAGAEFDMALSENSGPSFFAPQVAVAYHVPLSKVFALRPSLKLGMAIISLKEESSTAGVAGASLAFEVASNYPAWFFTASMGASFFFESSGVIAMPSLRIGVLYRSVK